MNPIARGLCRVIGPAAKRHTRSARSCRSIGHDPGTQPYSAGFPSRHDAGPHPLSRVDGRLLVRAVFASEGSHSGLHDRARIKPEFDKRGVKIIGLSVDPVDKHAGWANDIKETQGYAPNYPIIGDCDLKIAKLYDMLPATATGDASARTAADNQTVRNVFIIGPDKKIKLVLVYPMTTGRNFDEVLRVIDSLQLTAKHKVATPVNWKHGEDVIIAGSVSDEEAKKQYPQGWKAPRPYIRIVAQPHG